ncbi:MAG: hypothetical protein L6R38_009634, partial [Xanthoria sp. 2 TBL-2021]
MTDLELAYRFLATPDPSNPISSLFNPPSSPPSKNHRKILGICKPWFSTSHPSVLSACNAAIDHYTSLGYETVSISLPYLHEGQLAHALTILTEISTDRTSTSALSSLTPANQILLSVGTKTPANDFLLAQKMRALLMSHLAYLWEQYPGMLIVTPTTPNAGWPISGGEGDLKYGISDADMSLR